MKAKRPPSANTLAMNQRIENMQFDESTIRNVVAQVLAEIGGPPPIKSDSSGQFGVFH